MASPNSREQKENNPKIREDPRLKKQPKKGKSAVAANIAGSSAPPATPAKQLTDPTPTGQPKESGQGVGAASAPRSSSIPANALGFFIPQDSLYGNSFIPVLPRFDPLPPNESPDK